VSFRNRLALFFVLIVIVPMLAVTFLLFRLIAQSENGKSDAAFNAQNDVAQRIFAEDRRLAQRAIVTKIAGDDVFTSSLQDGRRARAAKRARQLVKFQGIERIVLEDGGRIVLRAGDSTAIAPAHRKILSSTRRELGTLELSLVDARSYAAEVRRVTRLHVVVRDGRTVLASTLPALGTRVPPGDGKEISVGGHD
jgi:hypothetical protein